MAAGIKRSLRKARDGVEKEILDYIETAYSERSSSIAGGLAAEGYNGGYRDALDDVLLALNGVTPSRNGWWE